MALKPTIFKLDLYVSNFNTDYYANHSLVLAQHPSETLERLAARLAAFCFNASENLSFSTGLSKPEDPDIWQHDLSGQIIEWIDVGEPSFDYIKKATRLAPTVSVYSFNTKSAVWWQQSKDKLLTTGASFYSFDWDEIKALANCMDRVMNCSVSISDQTAIFMIDDKELSVSYLVYDLSAH